MITAIILANNDAKAITRTLNALIGATVDGLVREVILLAVAGNDTAAKLADHSGCVLEEPRNFAVCVKAAKSNWLMILEAGALPEQGWAESVGNHMQSEGGAARFTRSPLAKRKLIHFFLQRDRPLALGLLIEKSVALNESTAVLTSAETLANATKRVPILASLRPASNVHPNAA